MAQYRAHGRPVECTVETVDLPVESDGPRQALRVIFDEAQAGVAPGQAVVLYDGDRVIGSATIATTAPASRVSQAGWPATVAATGVGSLPGIDPLTTATWVLDELADLPHLPELPDRGLGADAIGRSAGLLVDLPVEATPGGWQVTGRPGSDLATARRLLTDDLAALEIAAHGYCGPLKVQVVGPITLAASLGRPSG